jgi:hypothetical protein
MPLDDLTLQTNIKDAFEKAKKTPPPADPSQADAVQEKILSDLSTDLMTAIRTYLLSADVTGVTVNVVGPAPANPPLGTGAQTGVGKLK